MIALLSCLFAAAPEQGAFLKILLERQGNPCPTCSSGPEIPERESGKSLMVFISFSAPIETWKDLSAQLEKTEGYFVVKGVPGNSFEKLGEQLFGLKFGGVGAPIDIDPGAFERYKVDVIPAFVLEDGNHWDKIEGNLRLDAALAEMAEKGETSSKAREILNRIKSQ